MDYKIPHSGQKNLRHIYLESALIGLLAKISFNEIWKIW